ncbi:MAG: hypothetical protein JWM80_1186 [Cyanobacteria bacterium RYN_339]|nr:hypothetical protein [Cyanobacteria bacterium RYN_339]
MTITAANQTLRPGATVRPSHMRVAATGAPAPTGNTRANNGSGPTSALRSPQAYQSRVISLISQVQVSQKALSAAQQASPVNADTVAAAVKDLDAAQTELGVLKLLGARCAATWAKSGFDFGTFWKAQLAAAPDLMVVDGVRGGFTPKFGDKDHYRNFVIRLVGQARTAAADLAALQAGGRATPAELDAAQTAVRAAEAELVLMKKEAHRNRIPWRLHGFNVMKLWQEQEANLPKGFNLDKTQLVDQVRIGGYTLKPDVVVKLWDGEDPEKAIEGNNSDNLVFRMTGSKDVYVATAVDLGMGKATSIAPGDEVSFRGQTGTVVAVTSPVNSKIRAQAESSKAGLDSVKQAGRTKNFLPFVALMTGSVVLLASTGGSIITAAGLKIGLAFGGIFFGGLVLMVALAAMASHFHWLTDISLYKSQAHGDPQYFAPPVG